MEAAGDFEEAARYVAPDVAGAIDQHDGWVVAVGVKFRVSIGQHVPQVELANLSPPTLDSAILASGTAKEIRAAENLVVDPLFHSPSVRGQGVCRHCAAVKGDRRH